MSFFERLEQRARAIDSLICVGLDPHPAEMGGGGPVALRSFCQRLIDATAGVALAFKPNAAFFEAHGGAGFEVLRQVIASVPEGIPVILDAKRGDIASTAEAYARTAFETLGAGAVTVSPYLGGDSVAPFLRDPERAAFVLARTSNPGAADFQDLATCDPAAGGPPIPLYEAVARRAALWPARANLGLVAGATEPAALARVRAAAPDLWLLAPGVGAQGGELAAALRAGLRADGLGLLVAVSRSLSQAPDPAAAARALQREVNAVRAALAAGGTGAASGAGGPLPPPLAELADGLLDAGCLRFGRFRLKSGLESPIYIDLRNLAGHPPLLARAAAAYRPLLARLEHARIAALPYAALPIGTAIALQTGTPLIYPRREVKEYGTRAAIEGEFEPGEQVAVIDDLATTGASKLEAIERLEAAGLTVRDVVVLIDRQSGAAAALAQAGLALHSVFTLTQLLDHWERSGRVPSADLARARAFLAGA